MTEMPATYVYIFSQLRFREKSPEAAVAAPFK
jgi:hypothetical protein